MHLTSEVSLAFVLWVCACSRSVVLYKVTTQQIRWSISLYVRVLVRDSVGIFIYLLNVFRGGNWRSAFTFVPNYLQTLCVCHTNYRYISKYICVTMLSLPVSFIHRMPGDVYSFHCWKNLHRVVNNDRKHIPNLVIDGHWCHFSHCGGNTVYPVRPNSG